MISMESENNNHPLAEKVLPELEQTPSLNLPSNPNQLLDEAEHRRLNAELARLAELRQRIAVESRDTPMH